MSRVTITDEQVHAAQAGDDMAMWGIIQTFDPMFQSMIRSAAPAASTEDAEDLLQEARAVLIQHIRDYRTGGSSASLSSFVFQAARRCIAEEYVRMTTGLTVDPTAVLRVRRALWHADGDVEKAWETLSTCSNTAGRMGRERFTAVLEALAGTESFDAPAGGRDSDEGLTLADVIADPEADVSTPLERRDLAHWLLTKIPPRQCFALRASYGIQMTAQDDAQTAMDLGVRTYRVRDMRRDGTVSARKVAAEYGVHA